MDYFSFDYMSKAPKLCERCGLNPPNGTIGSLIDANWSQWVCKKCYKEIFPNSKIDEAITIYEPSLEERFFQ